MEKVTCLDCSIDLSGMLEDDDVPVCSGCAFFYDWYEWNEDYDLHLVNLEDWINKRRLYRKDLILVKRFVEEIEAQEEFERQKGTDYHEGYADGLLQSVSVLQERLGIK